MKFAPLLAGALVIALASSASAETLTIATVNNGDMVRMQGLTADFTAANPDVVVNVRPYANHDEAKAALDAQLEAGTPPDAFLASLEDVKRLAEEKTVRREEAETVA